MIFLHSIFKLALVQTLNCTYGVHPEMPEVGNSGIRGGGCPVSQRFLLIRTERPFRTHMMEKSVEQAIWAAALRL